jgi:hypothetical protein
MALMIETDYIGIARFLVHQLKFRMVAGEGGKHLRVTARRPWHFEDDLLGYLRSQMKRGWRELRPFLSGRLHDSTVVVTGGAMQIRDLFHPPWSEVLLMAD